MGDVMPRGRDHGSGITRGPIAVTALGVIALAIAAIGPVESMRTPSVRAGVVVLAALLVTHLAVMYTKAQRRLTVLERAATTDRLTGLLNRAGLEFELRLIERRHEQSHHSVLFVDLDCFKLVNDSLGHAAGDEVLIRAAQRLHRVLRPSDVIARLGGDEFVIVTRANADEARLIGQRVQEALVEPYAVALGQAVIGASVGIAQWAEGIDVLGQADKAMYQAKANGRNGITTAA
jgi:diguanylate cyclase (GGDEF)-like protein